MESLQRDSSRTGPWLWLCCFQFFVAEQIARLGWPTHYSMARDYISDLGSARSPLHWVMNGSFMLQEQSSNGSWFDLTTQRVLEMMQSLPLLVMAIIMAAALGPSLHNTILAIAIPLVPYVARVIRANTLSLREQPFVEAAKAIGMSERRIAIRHILPNTLAPLIVLATAQIGSVILIEASLSFLGLGVPEPHPSWGRMLSESAAEYVRTAPWLVIFPGAAISFVVFGTNLLGDALRDLLDPRQRS